MMSLISLTTFTRLVLQFSTKTSVIRLLVVAAMADAPILKQCFVQHILAIAVGAILTAGIDAIDGIVTAIDEKIIALEACIVVVNYVRIDESTPLGVIVAGLEVIQFCFSVLHVSGMAFMGATWHVEQ